MVTHILLWNYRPEVGQEERDAIEAMLAELPGLVPSIRNLSFGPVFRWRVREYERASTLIFDDETGLDAYQSHPAHKAFAARFHPTTSELVAIDYAS